MHLNKSLFRLNLKIQAEKSEIVKDSGEIMLYHVCKLNHTEKDCSFVAKFIAFSSCLKFFCFVFDVKSIVTDLTKQNNLLIFTFNSVLY